MRVAVIGGAGQMGQWLVKYLKKQGHKLVISDIHKEKASVVSKTLGVHLVEDNREAVRDVDLVIISVPVESIQKVISEVAVRMKAGSVLMEVASIKGPIIESLKALLEYDVHPLSVHPLFGPGAEKLENLKIAMIPVVDPKFEEVFIRDLFPEAEIIVVEADKHDKTMAVVLSLPYFMNLIFASTIADEDINFLKRLSGTTFTLQFLITEGLLSQDPQLHASIHFNNPKAEFYLRRFLEQTEALASALLKKDEDSFRGIYDAARFSLRRDEEFSKAYKRMYALLESLVDL